MYNLNALTVFLKVSETQGFTSAAQQLNFTKSKVSRLISELEEQLKVRLFERSTRHVRPTEAGEIFYQYAQRIIYEAEQAESSLHSIAQNATGTLKISASTSVGQYLLGPALDKFIKDYPAIEIDLDISNRRVDLIEENYDVALRIGELPDSSLIAKRVGTIPLKLYASEAHLAQFGQPQTVSDLHQHKLLCMPNAIRNNQLVFSPKSGYESASPNAGSEEAHQLNFIARINDFGIIHQLAKSGLGIALLPTFMCHSSHQLKPVLSNWKINPAPLHIVYPSHRGVTPKLRAFIDFVDKDLKPKLLF